MGHREFRYRSEPDLHHVVDWRDAHRAAPARIARIWLFVKVHLLAFAEHLESSIFDRAAVEEEVVAPRRALRLDEAEAFIIANSLDRACRHWRVPFLRRSTRTHGIA